MQDIDKTKTRQRQHNTRQHTTQDKTRQDNTTQHNTRQDEARQDKTRQGEGEGRRRKNLLFILLFLLRLFHYVLRRCK